MKVAVVTYGGHGGTKCAGQLRQVLEGGLDMKVVSCEEVMVSLPVEYIKKSKRVEVPAPDWLEAYTEQLDIVLKDLVRASW